MKRPCIADFVDGCLARLQSLAASQNCPHPDPRQELTLNETYPQIGSIQSKLTGLCLGVA
eukprot:1874453-Rhodomonas_salina.1